MRTIKLSEEFIEELPNIFYQVSFHDGERYWSKGTAFSVSYKDKSYMVTASHCVDQEEFSQIVFCNFKHEHSVNIPLSGYIKSKDKSGVVVDTDVLLFIINEDEIVSYLSSKFDKEKKEEFIDGLLRTPLAQNLKRRTKGNGEKFIKRLFKTSLYKKYIERQNTTIKQQIKNIPASLSHFQTLVLNDKSDYIKGTPCIVAGFPSKKSYPTLDEYGYTLKIHQHLQVLAGTIGSYYKGSDTYEFILNTPNESLDGFSGSPVIQNNKVIGMVSFCEKGKLRFVPDRLIRQILDESNGLDLKNTTSD